LGYATAIGAETTSLKAMVPKPRIGGVDIADDWSLGEAAVDKTGHRGKEGFAVEPLELLAGVPQLHHLPPSLDGTGRKCPSGLGRGDVANSIDNSKPVLGGAAREERKPEECHGSTLGGRRERGGDHR